MGCAAEKHSEQEQGGNTLHRQFRQDIVGLATVRPRSWLLLAGAEKARQDLAGAAKSDQEAIRRISL
jgi:hypothetical protein